MLTFAIPAYSLHIERMRAKQGEQLLIAYLASQERYKTDKGVYATDPDDLDVVRTHMPGGIYHSHSVDDIPSRLVMITRSGGSFTLCINSKGVISCDGNPDICAHYAPGGAGICP